MPTNKTIRNLSLSLVLAGFALATLTITGSGCTSVVARGADDAVSKGLRFERTREFFCDPLARACLAMLDTDGPGWYPRSRQSLA
jgi:hypothetical protein